MLAPAKTIEHDCQQPTPNHCALPAQAHKEAKQGLLTPDAGTCTSPRHPNLPLQPLSRNIHTLVLQAHAHLGGVGAVYEQDVAAWGPHWGIGEGAGGSSGGFLGPGCIHLPAPKLSLHRALHLGWVEVACMDRTTSEGLQSPNGF